MQVRQSSRLPAASLHVSFNPSLYGHHRGVPDLFLRLSSGNGGECFRRSLAIAVAVQNLIQVLPHRLHPGVQDTLAGRKQLLELRQRPLREQRADVAALEHHQRRRGGGVRVRQVRPQRHGPALHIEFDLRSDSRAQLMTRFRLCVQPSGRPGSTRCVMSTLCQTLECQQAPRLASTVCRSPSATQSGPYMADRASSSSA